VTVDYNTKGLSTNNMNTDQIIKLFTDELSAREREEVLNWVHESKGNKKEFIKLKNAWSLSATDSGIKSQQIENAWQTFKIKIRKNRNRGTSRLPVYFKYAAMFIIAFGAGLIAEKLISLTDTVQEVPENMAVIQAPPGQGAQVTLPDGSNVYLNSGTQISYSNNFLQDNRIVSVIGEAFFEVSKDRQHPFIIKTDKLDLIVHGTSFNVEAYDPLLMNVTLVEGSLGLNSKNGKELVRLQPGEKANYDSERKKVSIEKVDTELYTSWRKGIITFRNVALCDIIGKIERWYNVNIEIVSDELKNQRYSGTLLKSKPVDQILEALSITASFSYEIQYIDDAPTLIKLKKSSEQ
jgi:ferric-dicitrate binding protein FerR (iron transport regulator)